MTLLSLKFFLFLAISVFAYYLSPLHVRVYVLSVLSMLFYLLLGIVSFICILAVASISFCLALWIERRGREGTGGLLFISVLLVLIIWLGVRGAVGLSLIALPIGISFYSLRVISYLADVKRGSVAAEKNFLQAVPFLSLCCCCVFSLKSLLWEQLLLCGCGSGGNCRATMNSATV